MSEPLRLAALSRAATALLLTAGPVPAQPSSQPSSASPRLGGEVQVALVTLDGEGYEAVGSGPEIELGVTYGADRGLYVAVAYRYSRFPVDDSLPPTLRRERGGDVNRVRLHGPLMAAGYRGSPDATLRWRVGGRLGYLRRRHRLERTPNIGPVVATASTGGFGAGVLAGAEFPLGSGLAVGLAGSAGVAAFPSGEGRLELRGSFLPFDVTGTTVRLLGFRAGLSFSPERDRHVSSRGGPHRE